MAVEWGSLEAYEEVMDVIGLWFWQTYDSERLDKKFLGGLPLTDRGHRFDLVEGKRVLLIISYRPGGVSANVTEYEVYSQSVHPWLAEVEEEEIPAKLKLGDIAAMRPYPFPPPPRKRQPAGRVPFPRGLEEEYEPDPELDDYMEEVKDWTINWAVELAGAHMARTHPDFEQARTRMREAYGKLFELEIGLREFIESTLQSRFGKDWWNQVLGAFNTETVDLIKKRQKQGQHNWLDDFNTSRTRFLDFDHYRQIILKHKDVFTPAIPNVKELTDLLRDLVPMRHRVGHVNTLTADNYEDFIRMSNRVIAVVLPRPES